MSALAIHVPEGERSLGCVIGRAPEWLPVEKILHRASQKGRCTVLITGAQGTGKEVVARELHRRSPRAGKPFQVIDCSVMNGELFRSELFGHRRGSFTGADRDKRGLIAAAEGGTAFLDEIGELPPDAQARLLRFLQDHDVRAVGDDSYVHVDVRVIAATNRTLEHEMEAGRFRRDLYDRLNVVHVRMPTLKERLEDIPLLAEYFLRRYCELEGVRFEPFDQDAISLLTRHDWPGNVRQLEKFIERYCVFGAVRGELRELLDEAFAGDEVVTRRTDNTPWVVHNLDELRNWKVAQLMDAHHGNKTMVTSLLGVSRHTLDRYLGEIGSQKRTESFPVVH